MPADVPADVSSPDRVEIRIGGQLQADWTSYDVDSDLMTPADAWSVTLSQRELTVPATVEPGASVEVRVGGELVITGQLDERRHRVDKAAHTLELSGRDGAAVLLDCSAPILSVQDLTLEAIIAKVVRPLGITRVRVDADVQIQRDRVSTEPGDTAWSALQRAAEANGLWPWFTPDGTLVVGGPDYAAPPVAQLSLRRSGSGNLLSLTERRSIAERYSEVTVLGQAHAVGDRPGRAAVKAVVQDEGVPVHRPRVLIDHEATNETIARARGRKFLSDARVRGYDLQATVAGHRHAAGGLWAPGQRVHVVSEPHGIDGVYFLMARRFSGGRDRPTVTTLTLREDGAWVLDAHPSKRRHRRGKNAPSEGAIVTPEGLQ